MFSSLYDFFKNKRVLILGLGREGRSTLEILKKIPCTIGISDKNLTVTDDIKDYELYSGENYLDCIDNFDIIMKSPGIALFNDVSEETKAKITSQTDLLLRFCKNIIIGITGTKGKSTTSSLTCHILKNCGMDAILIGNIGIPPLERIEDFKENTIIVCEMSCHQLEYVKASPDIAVLLNVFEEHLDHYVDFNAYKSAKENIYKYQSERDTLIINKNNLKDGIKSETVTASLTNNADICLNENRLIIGKKSFDTANIRTRLIGRHNLYNIGIAVYIAEKMGCRDNDIFEAVSTFSGLTHRLEEIGVFGGVHYINDSISTCPSTAIAAVNAFGKTDTLIIGGMDRGIDYTELINFVNQSDIDNIILLPDSGYRIFDRLDGGKRNILKASDMEEAVKTAKSITKYRCILSPAAASYGFYKNFEERGEHFRKLVKEICGEESE